MSDTPDVTPLGEFVRPWRDDHRGEIREASERSRRLVRLGLDALAGLEVPEDLRPMMVSALWARCLEHYEAVIVLVEQGLVTPAWVSLRALLEALFTILAVAKDDEVRDLYLKEDTLQRRKLARKLREVTEPRFKKHVDPALEKRLDEEIAKSGARHLSTELLATRAGLKDWYLIVYALLTGPAHTKVRHLQKYLDIEQGRIKQFRFPAPGWDAKGLLSTAGITLVLAFDAFSEVFGRGLADARDEYLGYFLELGNRVPDDDGGEGV